MALINTQRLHVKNLPSDIDENDFKKFFKSLPCVSDITIKNDFGFFSVTCSPQKVEEAIQDFSGKKWKGSIIALSRAKKDNFMARLAEERIAAKSKKPEEDSVKVHTLNKPGGAVGTKRKFDNDAESESDSDDTKAGIPRFRGTKMCKDLEPEATETASENKTMEELAEFDAIWKDDEDISHSANLSSYLSKSKTKVSGQNTESKAKSSPKLAITKQQKKVKDDERRRSSLANKEKERKRQQDLIKSALGTGVGASSKKIIFSDDDGDSKEESPKRKMLFEDNDDNDLTIPDMHPFDGANGNKLMNLQSQFNNDSRFKMDERFLEDTSDQIIEKRKPNEMVRFDPKKQKNDTNSASLPKEKNDKASQPRPVQASREKFYEVAENIKSALVDKAPGFSLLATYGGNNENKVEQIMESAVQMKPSARKNPFVASDSSSDEEMDEKPTRAQSHPNLWSAPIFTDKSSDKFFFADNDPLFAEAMEFMNKKNSEEAKAYAEGYEQTREVLRRIFKDQSLRRAKKNDAFKKKVGGRKNVKGFQNKKPGNFGNNYNRHRGGVNGTRTT